MSRETYTEIEKLNKLSVGRFFCKIFNGQSFVLEVPKDHLDTTTCISKQERETLFEEQQQRFYLKRISLQQKASTAQIITQGFRGLSMHDEVFTPKY
ncbi:hypothetical protein [Haliscomenobacter sp.]|uniref:hypothetical protein n=1 Tax=Haliscomenobacter sp. TaxID=2717303 RepID=UPI003BABB151